jgi:hypothetical protein
MTGLFEDWDAWLAEIGVPVGTPFLTSPLFECDVQLNMFVRCPSMLGAAPNTQTGYARNLKAFLDFLWAARGSVSWRDAARPTTLLASAPSGHSPRGVPRAGRGGPLPGR